MSGVFPGERICWSMNEKTGATLVIMAAGLASRYGGSKQIDGMGPSGELLMEYTCYDAIRAGFDRIVFIITPAILDKVRLACGDAIARRVRVNYAFQDSACLPEGCAVESGRTKPLGTLHAVWCARQALDTPFAVINADDFYGADAFCVMYKRLIGLRDGQACMVGYRLRNTVSPHGSVTRGICRSGEGRLESVTETYSIFLREDGRIVSMDGGAETPLDPESIASMNFWGFVPSALDGMGDRLADFLRSLPEGELKRELPLPVYVDSAIAEGGLSVDMLTTDETWFGVTYKEDKAHVSGELARLTREGVYPTPLFA